MTETGATFLVNDSNSVTMTTGYTNNAKNVRPLVNGVGATIYLDWLLVRKYSTSEPVVGTWGGEESPL